ncbi:MAG: universal stress protein [Halobacteriales archaeon]|nr:universal stress protein [Halobacteriales archaeon]
MALEKETTILVPVDISVPEEFDREVLKLFGPLRVVLLGYYPVPDQSATDQARTQFEEEATVALDEIADGFADETDVESVLVFTHDKEKTVERVAAEKVADAILTPGDVDKVRDVLVPIRGDPNLDNIAGFVGALMSETDATVTLFHVATDEDEESTGEYLLRGVADRLVEDGVDPDRIDTKKTEDDSPASEILELAEDHDVLVIGESEPSLRKRILGNVPTNVIEGTEKPVLVVRKPEETEDED